MKLIQPAIDSIWENNKTGAQFRVVLSLHVKRECLLQATGTGRRHWVTYEGLAKKYTWIMDPELTLGDLEESVRADERVRVLKWLMNEIEVHQHDGESAPDGGVEHPSTTLRSTAEWLMQTLKALRDDETGDALKYWDQALPKGDPIPQEIPEVK
jgi:hypothetical protein